MAKNICPYMYRTGEICHRRCIAEYCAAHTQQIKNTKYEKIPCLVCNQHIRGKTKICLKCGGKRYRTFAEYYQRRYNITFTEDDFLTGNYKHKFKEFSSTKSEGFPKQEIS